MTQPIGTNSSLAPPPYHRASSVGGVDEEWIDVKPPSRGELEALEKLRTRVKQEGTDQVCNFVRQYVVPVASSLALSYVGRAAAVTTYCAVTAGVEYCRRRTFSD